MRFHGGTNTGSARDPNSAARQSRPAAISAAATEAGQAARVLALLALGRAVRVTPAVLQHPGRWRAGESSGQIRGRECRDHGQRNRPPARDPQQRRKLRGRGNGIVVAPPQLRDPARLAPAVKLGFQFGPIRGRHACHRERRGARHRVQERRGRHCATMAWLAGAAKRSPADSSSADHLSDQPGRARRPAGVDRKDRPRARGRAFDRRGQRRRGQLAFAYQLGGAERGQTLGPQGLFGLAPGGERHQHRARPCRKQVEDGVVAGLADRNPAGAQQRRRNRRGTARSRRRRARSPAAPQHRRRAGWCR